MVKNESAVVHRPKRWSEPMDVSMTDADVQWLRSREPFATMNTEAFPRTTPLEGILRNDCRIHRCEPGQIIVREGDYGNSAFLVLAGSVRVFVDALTQQQLGRTPPEKWTWTESLFRFLTRSAIPERRLPHEVTTNQNANQHDGTQKNASVVRQVDDRPAIFLQGFDAVFQGNDTVELGPGELFGEVAAMYRTPRTATVVSDTESTLLEIRWQGLRILRGDVQFAESMDAHYRQHWLAVHLREIPLLRHLPEASLSRVANATQMRSFGRMEWNADYRKTRQLPVQDQIESEPVVSQEGNLPTDLIVVRSGFGRVSQEFGASHRTTAYLGKGHLFGLEELAYNSARHSQTPPLTLRHSLRAVGFLDTLFIPAETFAEEILPHVRRSELPQAAAALLMSTPELSQPESSQPESSQCDDRRKNERTQVTSKKDDLLTETGQTFQQTSLLEFIVQNRMNNGRQAMVVDLHRCTRCDDCVKACASTHDGNPRFVRQGVSHDRLLFAQACMQCSDPVCMIGCPTGSIARDEGTGVVEIHDPICIGCGTCAASCPYENIRMAEVFDPQGRPYRDIQQGKPIVKATKCDMCSQQPSGPACVSACPHDALVRIDLTESKPLQHWLDQRS